MTIKDTIDTYRKRRNLPTPFFIGIIAILLVIIGVLIVVIYMSGGKGFNLHLFATSTPTPTLTYTSTETPSPTETPSVTPTASITPTITPSQPYQYTVQQGDSLNKLVKDLNLGDNGIVLILILNPYDPKTNAGINPSTQIIYAGAKIWLPYPGMPLPTATPWPANVTRIQYLVLPGDSLGSIASKTRSTVDAIVAANKTLLTKGASTTLWPGWVLIVPVNLVTAVPSPSATITPQPSSTPSQ